MKWLALAFVLAVPRLSAEMTRSGSNWMKSVDGSWSLARLSIPGTHDSGALLEPIPGTAKCQNLAIAGQLAAGVRFLDIRCRHVGDTFLIHHGPIDQKLTFEGVLGSVTGFLKSNPGECVILSVKEEYDAEKNTRSFEQTFDTYVARDPDRWWLKAELPTLGQVRGKIVLFRRFSSTSQTKGIHAPKWPDNTTFSAPPLRVQDHYRAANPAVKWSVFESLLKEALAAGNDDTLFVNFSSGTGSTFGIPNIPSISGPMNQRIATYFTSGPKGRHGVIVVDFVDGNLCQLIYEANFHKN